MIVPMEKVSVIVAAHDRLKTVRILRDLGIMHVEVETLAENPGRNDLSSQLAAITQVISRLAVIRPGTGAVAGEESGEAVYRSAEQLFADLDRLREELNADVRKLALLAAWGDFDAGMLAEIRAKGLQVYLCKGAPKVIAALRAKGLVCCDLSGGRGGCFAVVSEQAIPESELPIEPVPTDIRLEDLRTRIAAAKAEMAKLERELAGLRRALPLVKAYRDNIAGALEFVTVRDSFGGGGAIVSISGFVPRPELDRIRSAAAEHGWGLLYRPVDQTRELAPTLLAMPKWARIIEPLMNFLDISPGYHERDMSIAVLVFFTVFFGMLVGDAGYGTIFLLLALGGLLFKRDNVKLRRPLALLTLLSSSAIAWGALTGNYFGIQGPGLPWLASDPEKDRHIQLVCFLLGLAHMSLGHLVRMGDFKLRNMLHQLGWILVLAANVMLVALLLLYPGMPYPVWLFWLYGIGILLTAGCGIDWRDFPSIAGYPSNLVGSFVDVLSYIRLFAVGLSGYYLAKSFNDMARPFFEDGGLWIAAGMTILLLGHVLNIALSCLSVLVHGVRLNMLEFSSHSDLSWSGFRFDPFRRRIEDDQTRSSTIKE